jgi:YVTN family beta-propeller protein
VEVDDGNGHVFSANTSSDTVSVLADKTGSALHVIPVGKRPIDGVKDAVQCPGLHGQPGRQHAQCARHQ